MSAPRIKVSGCPATRGIAEAAAVLRRGALVILPTDTVYGMAADPRVPGAEKRLAQAKGRRATKPIPLLASGLAAVERWRPDFGAVGRELARRFWPGPLTLVLKTSRGWEGFRVPAHPVALALVKASGGLLRVTSANRSGRPPALTANRAAAALGTAAALVLDAGPAPGGIPSTVVRVQGSCWQILRAGAISRAAIGRVCRGIVRRGFDNGRSKV